MTNPYLEFVKNIEAGVQNAKSISLTGIENPVKLAREGYDVKFGARPLRRLIQRTVEDTLSEELLGGKIALGDRVRLKVADGKITVEKEA